MQEAYVNISDIPTHIMTWGKWIEESLGDTKEIVICITGNPGKIEFHLQRPDLLIPPPLSGLPGFYTKFLNQLHTQLEHQIPVWLIGHQGHDDPPATSIRKVPKLRGNEQHFNLDGQIKHKV